MAAVAASYPEMLRPGQAPDERQTVGRRAPDPGPPVRDRRRLPDGSLDELLNCPLDDVARLFEVGVLLLEARVAAAADHQPPIRELLPVVVAVPGVVRPVEQKPSERSRNQHLPSSRPHD